MGAPRGNVNSSKRNRIVGDTLRKVAKQNPEKLREACEKLLDKAVEGDIPAFKEFTDRLDGRPAQILTGPDDGPIQISEIKRVVIDDNEDESST